MSYIYTSEQAAALEQARLQFPQSREWLHDYCLHFLGVKLSRVAFDEKATPPLEIVAKLFNQEVLTSVLVGARGGGKTAIIGTLNFLNSFFRPTCETVQLASVLEQSIEGYKFFKFLVDRPGFASYVDGKCLAKLTNFKNGSTVKILTGSKTGVNAFHAHKLIVDEADLLGEDADFRNPVNGISIINELHGTVADEINGIKIQKIFTSSWKKYNGIISRLLGVIDDKELLTIPENARFFITPLETMRKCDKNCNDCDEIMNLSRDQSFYDYCQGRAKKADGWRSREAYWSSFRDSSLSVWNSQFLCQAPGVPNRVFPMFDLTSPKFVKETKYDPLLPLYCGMDWGYNDWSVAIYAQKQGEIWVNLGEYAFREMTHREFNDSFVKHTFEVYGKMPDFIWGDPSQKSAIRDLSNDLYMKNIKTIVTYPKMLKKDKIGRVSIMNNALEKGLIINDVKCSVLNDQMFYYSWKNTRLQDGNDDAIDAMGYVYIGFKEEYDAR